MTRCDLPSPFPPWVRTVGIFAPAGIPDPARLQRGCRRLEQWGLQVVTAGLDTAPVRYLAAADERRAEAIHALLRNPQVDLLLAARGGFGCARLFDRLDWGLLRRRRIPVVGYSDLSALHLAALRHGVCTGVAGPMVAVEFGRETRQPREREALGFAASSLRRVWQGGQSVALPPGARLQVLKRGCAAGALVPATLSVLISLLGTRHLPALAGTILVLEDVHEPAYRIDRCLTQLGQAGVLDRLAGLVFGSFTLGEDAEWLPAVCAEFAARIDGPVAAGLPFGHCSPSVALPIGRQAVLDTRRSRPVLRWDAWRPGPSGGPLR